MMILKRIYVCLSLLLMSMGVYAQQLPYKNPALPIDERVKDLLSRMTLEEKAWQLFMIPGDLDNIEPGQYKNGIFGLQVSATAKGKDDAQQLLKYNTSEDGLALVRKINAIQKHIIEETRLGIPIIAFDEALHGLVREGATSFPQAIALAATFDTTLMRKVSTAIAQEAQARGIRQVLSPVINIASDVRWGRVEETYGEDPFLTSEMGVAFVRSFEKMNIITTPKHFIANVGDGGRDSYPIHLNERYLKEIHFPPFIACIERGGARSIMTSYNSIDGTAASMNNWLLTKILKQDWKFSGFVISDASAVGGATVLHNTAVDYPTSGEQAINSGLDVIFQTQYKHFDLFSPAFTNGNIDVKKIDEAVTRVLNAKFQLGLFENPYMPEAHIQELATDQSHKKLAREASLKSIVLLKNDKNILPLSDNIRSIAVIGTDATEARLGGYCGKGNGVVTMLEGIQQRAGKRTVTYAPGCGRNSETFQTVPSQFLRSNNKPGLEGTYFNNVSLTGNPVLIRKDEAIDFHWTLYSPDKTVNNGFYSVRWAGQLLAPESGLFKIGLEGNDGFRLYINDVLIVDRWNKQTYSTSVADFHFEKNMRYAIRIEFYEPVGNAHIKLIWNVGVQEDWKVKISEAVSVAKKSDVVIVTAGINEGEFQDRAMLTLPGHQEELIRQLAETGKPVVVVLVGGSAVVMNNWIEQMQGVVDVWYPGEEGGHALAQVLFGDYNPAGRLPITFPMHEAQLPLVYNHKPTGRGDDYNNLSGLPLFPFGYGLSYTSFTYTNSSIAKKEIRANQSTTISFTLTNSGTRDGEEVVQLYIKDVLASVARPVMELKGFQRIALKAKESKEVSFTITPEMLRMLNTNLEWVVEPGAFEILIGASSRDIRLKEKLIVTP
jgi:beta-glucosidase